MVGSGSTSGRFESRYCVFVRNHVRLCAIDDHIVSLDLHTGRYALIECEDADRFLHSLTGIAHRSDPASYECAAFAALADELESAGILTRSAQDGHRHDRLSHNPHCRELPSTTVMDVSGYRAGEIIALSRHFFISKFQMAFYSPSRIFAALEHARSYWRSVYSSADSSAANLVDLHETYVKHRVVFHRPRDSCMTNSLFLARFLAAHGVFPHWHFGVQLRPFLAHCWLEDDEFVYGESMAYCRDFNLILRI